MKKSRRSDFDSESDDESSIISSNLEALPKESLHQIRTLAGPQATLRSSLVSNSMREIMQTDSPALLCIFVFKLLSRLCPKTRNWEGGPNRAAYWWIGQRGIMQGSSNKPPLEVSKRPGGPIVDALCKQRGYQRRCLACMRGLADYVQQRWRRHLAQHAYTSTTDTMIVFERPEDARSDRWDPPFVGTDCWRTGCCVAVVLPANGEAAYVTLAHASSVYKDRKRCVLLSPTPYADLRKRTAPEYVNFFLNRGETNASIRYISLWNEDGSETIPPLEGFRLFGTQFARVSSAHAIPDCGGGIDEIPVRQFGLAELQLNVDLHAISVPYRPRSSKDIFDQLRPSGSLADAAGS